MKRTADWRAWIATAVTFLTAAAPLGAQEAVETEDGRCVVPEVPEIPDGSTAPEADLAKAQQEVKTFLAAGDEFLACLNEKERSLAGDESEEALEKRALIVHLHNQFVAQMHGVGDRFNEAVRAFNAR